MAGKGGRKVAVVTGGTRGIGFAISRALADAGYSLAILGSNPANVKQAARRLPSAVLAEPCDVCDETAVASFFQRVRRRLRRIDVLINNAGIAGPTANVEKLAPEVWRAVIAINLTGTFLVTRAALPLMRRGATIVNNLSVSAKGSFPGMSAYNASKHGAAGFTATLREEVRGRGIRVIGLYPGATDTAIWKQFWPGAPRRRMMSPETIAAAVVHAIALPENATVEELVITPTGGAL